ncbi:hypothetical protein BD311DRAFT_747245 [Dichomitus squalens]|uniref:Uncharacterized protein n=1 Tax=Dichomitus squalens TaxID=114155 RepID=A0A4Q9N4I4_9APHY|nr:hypothetical protein BD311DRAFT_747245 [Dichomitus squalens]
MFDVNMMLIYEEGRNASFASSSPSRPRTPFDSLFSITTPLSALTMPSILQHPDSRNSESYLLASPPH